MKKISFILAAALLAGCTNSPLEQNSNINTKGTNSEEVVSSTTQDVAFFYQIVGPFINGSGNNSVRIGKTSDGAMVDSYQPDDTGNVLDWTQGPNHSYAYGDPVYSRLVDGTWIVTARSSNQDSRGSNYLLYHESSCPLVDDSAVVALGPSTAVGCKLVKAAAMGKTSQVFTDDTGKNYIFHMTDGSIYLTYLSDETRSATSLDSICFLDQPVTELASLNHGESTQVLARGSGDGLLLSDTAIARRSDGTWVLFVKGIEADNGCEMGSLCELCGRSIYRSTSTDLVHWSDLEKVVEQGSIPEAITATDGTVWLYWQDFSNACEAEDLKLANIAPIAGAYEQSNTNMLSDKMTVSFPDEDFEGNDQMHYATNGNPVTLPDAVAQADLEACL